MDDDIEAFFREQDKRMNLPDDDFDEYLNRMGTSRRSREITVSDKESIVNTPNIQEVLKIHTRQRAETNRDTDNESGHGNSESKATAVSRYTRSPPLRKEGLNASGNDETPRSQKASPIIASGLANETSTQTRLHIDKSDQEGEKKQPLLTPDLPHLPSPRGIEENDNYLIPETPCSNEITSLDINSVPSSKGTPTSSNVLKRKASANNVLDQPRQKKPPVPPRNLQRTPSPSLEEITSFSTCPRIRKSLIEPRPIFREKAGLKLLGKRKVPALEFKAVVPPKRDVMNISDPPTSPIEDPSDKFSSTNLIPTSVALQAGPSKMYLEVKERVAQHSALKRKDKVMKLSRSPFKSTADDESAVHISSSASEGASSPIPIIAKSGKGTSKNIQPLKAEKIQVKSTRGKKKEKPKQVTPIEYVEILRNRTTTIPRRTSEKWVQYKCLEGMNIFYIGGDMQYASERTRGRMDIIMKCGGNLLPKYDPSLVTHIITDAQKLPTLRALGLKKLSDIPNHIPTVVWSWVVSGIGKAPHSTKDGPKVRMDEVWMHAAFGERMDAGSEPTISKAKGGARSENSSHISEFTQTLRRRGSSSAHSLRDIHDSEVEEVSGNNSTGAPLSPPTSPIHLTRPSKTRDDAHGAHIRDPLAKFYAKARAERETEWSRYGEVEDDAAQSSDAETVEPIIPQKRGWTCDAKEVQKTTCVNQDIIDKLQELKELHQAKPSDDDHWRVFSYSKCIRALRNHPKRIESFAEARSIRGVGEKTAAKIMEILETGGLRRIEYEKTEDIEATRLFQGIYGVGRSTAYQWYASGCRTLDDVTSGRFGIKLTPAQEIGIHFYDDINTRMPREEAKEIFDLIKPIALKIDPKLFIEIMGSYRRGKLDCGDIDIMITRPPDDGKTHGGVLSRLLRDLHAAGIITEDLALPENPDDLEAIYRGLCRVPKEGSKRRRIDFLTVPWQSRGAALLYYTGDDIFNRAIRMKAGAMGYSLNQKGLFGGVVRDPRDRRVKLNAGTLVASETEEEIFKILNVPWQEPHQRVRG